MKNRFGFTLRNTSYILALATLLGSMLSAAPVMADSSGPVGQQVVPTLPAFTGDVTTEVYNFGAEMAMSGDTLVVGSDTGRDNGITVSVYVFSGNIFHFQTKLAPILS